MNTDIMLHRWKHRENLARIRQCEPKRPSRTGQKGVVESAPHPQPLPSWTESDPRDKDEIDGFWIHKASSRRRYRLYPIRAFLQIFHTGKRYGFHVPFPDNVGDRNGLIALYQTTQDRLCMHFVLQGNVGENVASGKKNRFPWEPLAYGGAIPRSLRRGKIPP